MKITPLASFALAAILLTGCTPTPRPPAAPDPQVTGTELVATEGGYQIPADITPAPRGTLITTIDRGPDAGLSGAQRTTLLYHSQDSTGADVSVTGALLIPRGTAPATGWPLVSWAHGTVGVADRCAPSLRDDFGYAEYADQIRFLIDAGYAVVATDYIGLGTPGTHTYMNKVDQGNAVADIVTAAHQTDQALSDTWFAIGHSQGGAAVLTATRSADQKLPAGLAGTIAVAPGNTVGAAVQDVALGRDTYPVRAVYVLFVLAGAAASGHQDVVDSVLTDQGRETLRQYSQDVCAFDAVDSFPSFDVSADYRQDQGALDALSATLDAYANPDDAQAFGPIAVITGSDDRDVPAAGTTAMSERLRSLGSDVRLTTLPGADHDTALTESRCQQVSLIAGWSTEAPVTPAQCS